jgi:hypothetical protein
MATKRKEKPTLVTAALKKTARGGDDAPPAAAAAPKAPARRETTRQGRVTVSGWLPIAARSSLLLIRAKYPEKRMQDLVEEAFDDLFAKYNVPQTAKAS